MSPDEAYDELRTDFEAAVEAVAPDITGEVFEPARRGVPCGGPFGTERSSVQADLSGLLGRSDWDGDPEATAARLSELAQERGYELRLDERGGRTRALTLVSSADEGAFVMRFGLDPDGTVTLSGSTPCLPAAMD